MVDIMDEMIACCGIICTDCPALQATLKNDNNERETVAKAWSKLFGTDYKIEDINCEGCKSVSGRLFSYCGSCQIRECCKERDLENCAYCLDYSCDKLDHFIENEFPSSRQILEEIREKL